MKTFQIMSLLITKIKEISSKSSWFAAFLLPIFIIILDTHLCLYYCIVQIVQ